jgi:hypothetical protein
MENMNEAMQPFLNDGLNVYVKAKATIAFFEQEITELLLAGARRRQKLPCLDSHKISRCKSNGDGSYGHWIAIFFEGLSHLKEPVKIDCGVWWNSPEKDEPIVYASFYEEPKRVLVFSGNEKAQEIKSFVSYNRTYLYLPASKATDIGDSLNRILDELLKQLR